MFTNKHDPLVDSVKSVMEKNNLRRQVEEALNEELGVSSRKAIPHEHLASYDAMLEEAYKCAMNESGLIKAIGTAVLSRGTAVTRPPGRSVEPYTGPVYGGKLKSTDVPKTSISGPKTSGPGVAFKTPTPEEPEVKQKHDNNKSDDTRYTLLPSGKMIPVGGGEAIDAGSTVKDYGGMKYPEYTRDKYGEFQGRGMPLSEPKSNKNVTDFAPSPYSSLNEKNLSSKQKQFAKLGTVTGEGGSAKEIDQHDLRAARKGHAHKVGLEEKLTKSMSAGDVISDFVHSKNPKFKGKSKKKRMEMALGAYYSKHPEKSKKMDESLESIMEEIRANLEEKLVSVYESGDAQMFEEFVSSLTEEQLELLGLNEQVPDFGSGRRDSKGYEPPSGMGARSGIAGSLYGGASNIPTQAGTKPNEPEGGAFATIPRTEAPGSGPKQAPVPAAAPSSAASSSLASKLGYGGSPSSTATEPRNLPTAPSNLPKTASDIATSMTGRPAGTPPPSKETEAPKPPAGYVPNIPKVGEQPIPGTTITSQKPATGPAPGSFRAAQETGMSTPTPKPTARPSTPAPASAARSSTSAATNQSWSQQRASMGYTSRTPITDSPRLTQAYAQRMGSRSIAGNRVNDPTANKFGNVFNESTHIKESLESMIRSKYLKG